VKSESDLLALLTTPSDALVEFIRALPSPLLVLGAGGKMGPSLCGLARRAAELAGHRLDILAVSRFTDSRARQWLEDRGVKTISADLLDRTAVQSLPDAPNVINLTGLKFGTAQNPALTWATNTIGPMLAAERFTRSRIVALSTGNVYPLVPVAGGGAREDHPLTPLGEYANAAVARERVFEYLSQHNGTPIALIRLNFAVELRYGVLVDIARRVWSGQPVDITNCAFNCIWQGDANDMILRALALATSPARARNLSHPVALRVRAVAQRFGELFGKSVQLTGQEAADAFLCNPTEICARLGPPPTPLETVMQWTAHWIRDGGVLWNKSTHFEVRNGAY
jgi:nucleoside-diphosphate-sugar epimerase